MFGRHVEKHLFFGFLSGLLLFNSNNVGDDCRVDFMVLVRLGDMEA